MKLRCYCCGEPIEGAIALVSQSTLPVDRVFVAKPDHLENFDGVESAVVAEVQ